MLRTSRLRTRPGLITGKASVPVFRRRVGRPVGRRLKFIYKSLSSSPPKWAYFDDRQNHLRNVAWKPVNLPRLPIDNRNRDMGVAISTHTCYVRWA